MRHRPAHAPSASRPPTRRASRVSLGLSALLLSVAGCNVGGSILVPLRDASAKDLTLGDIGRADVADVPVGDAPALDAGVDVATEVGVDAAADVGIDAATDLPVDAPVDAADEPDGVGDAGGVGDASDAGADVVCGIGESNCAGSCHNLVMDPANCGACGNACPSGQVCSDARCATVCSAPSVLCGGACVLLGDDERHCGACGRACAATEICAGGSCSPRIPASSIGCADGTREAYPDPVEFPNIAACAGGFSVAGVFPAPVRVGGAMCATSGNSNVSNVNGVGCSAADLCAPGWHICRGGEVGPATRGLSCTGTTFPVDEFYAAAVSGPGCYRCALLSNTTIAGCTSSSCTMGCRERNDLNNDIFGCGAGRASVDCELAVTAGDRCVDVPGATWTCPSDTSESLTVTKAEAAGGGVLCCRG